ncbi:hypothetical protein [Chondromyces crocatus]|uniref:Uncharacterized protein n=1 Tax=Chondromyces crocatus TaxID=52 RepID=A0A0K1EL97_CHOCO|nr:hypothetical protein [Chondromyces crocatus]AKT41654.1 uncharacterized protein CMC5_058600 [Chondromyces crocatus]
MPALRFLWPLAALGVLATLIGKMLAPSIGGITVGLEGLVLQLDRAGGMLSQLFALLAVVATSSLVSLVSQSRSPIALRVFAVMTSSLVALEVIYASGRERVPEVMAVFIAGIVGTLALVAAWDARRAVFSRHAALVLGLLGLGGLLRLAGALLAVRAIATSSVAVGSVAQGLSTAAFVLDGLGALVAAAGLVKRRDPRASAGSDQAPTSSPLLSPMVLLALGLAFVATRYAASAASNEVHPGELLVFRMLDRLVVRPLPTAPLGAQHFVAALSFVMAGLALAVRRPTPALSAVVALALLSRGAVGAPLGAISLSLASMGILLAARDERGLWAALLGADRGRASGGGHGEKAEGRGEEPAAAEGVEAQAEPGAGAQAEPDAELQDGARDGEGERSGDADVRGDGVRAGDAGAGEKVREDGVER